MGPGKAVLKSIENCSLLLASEFTAEHLRVGLVTTVSCQERLGVRPESISTNWNPLAPLCPSVTLSLTTVTFREQWLPLHFYFPNLSPISLSADSVPKPFQGPAVFQGFFFFESAFPLVVTR